MATDIERLTVVLEANIKRYEKEMAKTRGVMDKTMRDVERSASGSMKRLEGILGGAGTRFKAGFAGILAGLSVQQIAQFADSFTKVQNSLKVAGLEGKELRQTYEQLFAASQRQGAPLEAMATLYGRISSAQQDLNATGPEMLRVTEGVATALRVSGTSATEASGALLQLGQALSGGKVQAEEYNSLLDGARPVLQAVAAGMVETGGSVSKLTALVKDGKVSSEAFFRALLAGLPVLEQQAQSTGQTMSQGWQKAQNSLINLVGKLDEALQASNSAAGGVNSFASSIDAIAAAVPTAMGYLSQLQSKMTEIGNWQGFAKLNQWLDQHGLLDKNIMQPVNQFDQVFGAKTSAGSMAGYKPPTAKPAVEPIRNSDYAVPGDEKGKRKKERLNELQREIQLIGERTRALDVERETVGLSAGEAAKAEAAFRLLEAAKEANVTVTPELKAQIDSLAAAYGEATQKVEDAQAAQEAAADAAREVGSMLSNAFQDAILEGEELDKVLQKMAKSLASKAFDNIFSNLFSNVGGGGGSGGLLGNLLGFGTGKAAGGSVYPGRAYTVGESGRETFVPTTPGRIIPNGKGGGGTNVQIISPPGYQAQQKTTNGPKGPTLQVQFQQMMAGMVASGEFDGVFKKRYGVGPMGGR